MPPTLSIASKRAQGSTQTKERGAGTLAGTAENQGTARFHRFLSWLFMCSKWETSLRHLKINLPRERCVRLDLLGQSLPP